MEPAKPLPRSVSAVAAGALRGQPRYAGGDAMAKAAADLLALQTARDRARAKASVPRYATKTEAALARLLPHKGYGFTADDLLAKTARISNSKRPQAKRVFFADFASAAAVDAAVDGRSASKRARSSNPCASCSACGSAACAGCGK
jgi:hypothetical protein